MFKHTLPILASTLICGVAAAEPRIVAVYLFGSQGDGSATPESDVDLGVLFRQSTGIADRVRLEARFAEALDKEVDLVDVGACNAFLAKYSNFCFL